MPQAGRIVFIGAGGVGLTAAFSLARKNPDLQITLFSRDSVVAYSQCGMPFVLDGKISGFDDLILYKPEVFSDLGLDVRTGTTVTSIDIDSRTVTTEKGETVAYEKLVIATGSIPYTPAIPGVHLKGVHRLITLDDGRSLLNTLPRVRSAVIVGGGPIGLETAPAFLHRGIKTTIVERMPQLMPGALDTDMASIVEEYLAGKGATIITGKSIDSINGSQYVESVTAGGETIPADMVLLSAGVRPNAALAKDSGIDIGPTGGIAVDEFFRVKRNGRRLDDVLAAGDCAEVTNAVTGKPMTCAVGSIANRQAAYIADGILGRKVPYRPVICPTICVIGELQAGSVGLTSRACESAGISPVTFKARGNTRARYYPGGKKVDIKLISDGERIIGGQVIGEEGVHGRINVLSLGISKSITPEELAAAETCYAPPVSPMIDPMNYAAEMLALRCARAKKR